MKSCFVLLLVILCFTSGYSQHIVSDPWEPGEERTITNSSSLTFARFFYEAADSIISFYQQSVSPLSVSRCPFKISCSVFARQALQKRGILGAFLFIDRYFYRENGEAFLHYNLNETSQHTLKFDDSFFLEN